MKSITPGVIREKLSRYPSRRIQNRNLTRSAVLMLVVDLPSGLHLLLTKRTDIVEHHKGQISFPGGAQDPTDKSAVATALRESFEEIGLEGRSVEIWGTLDDVQTPSGFVITPVVGFLPTLPLLRSNAEEVEEILMIPLREFLDKNKRRSVTVERNNAPLEIFFYDVWKEPVWGATAFFIKRFVDLLEEGTT